MPVSWGQGCNAKKFMLPRQCGTFALQCCYHPALLQAGMEMPNFPAHTAPAALLVTEWRNRGMGQGSDSPEIEQQGRSGNRTQEFWLPISLL